MEISCLPTRQCLKYFQVDLKPRLTDTPSICQTNCDAVPLTSIIDLNDDCLEAIFVHLNIRQLFVVATVHARFLIACRRALLKNYKNKEVVISVHQSMHPDYTKAFHLMGDVISRVRITYGHSDETAGNFNDEIHDAIVNHCTDTLTEVAFNHIHPTMEINKSFQSLKKLHFNQGCVGKNFSEFNKWFPKLVSLEFFFSKTINARCIEQRFPHLEHFTVAHHNFSIENLRSFLDQNQQLKSFTVYSYDYNLIQQLDEYTRAQFTSLYTKFEIYPCYLSFNNDE